MAKRRLRVAVIGAGGSGLCCARHILSHPEFFEPPVVFEMMEQVGGVWFYTEEVGSRTHVHSSVYRDLRTNLPKEVMEFPDFAFDSSLPSYFHHSEVLRYLEDYTDHFSIRSHIRFNTRVVCVSPVLGEGENIMVSWDVTTETEGDRDPVTDRFDAVMVCVGHYSEPFVPHIEGIENFEGQVLHSHYYRIPEVFSSRSVVLLGAGPSGTDIALELSSHAKHVTLSHRGSPFQWNAPENISQAPPVVQARPTSLICEDRREIEADTLMFCTGYKYHYPFLLPEAQEMFFREKGKKETMLRKQLRNHMRYLESDEWSINNEEMQQSNGDLNINGDLLKNDLLEGEDILGPDVGQGHLPPLYKHLIHARYPTLAFIGACKHVLTFPFSDCQAQFFLSFLEGKCQLPVPEKMLSECRKEVRNAQNFGIPLKYLRRLEAEQWEYNRWFAEAAGFKPLAPVLDKLLRHLEDSYKCHHGPLRHLNFQILNREEFESSEEVLNK